MSRHLAFVSIAALLTAAAHAQCLGPATGTSLVGGTFVKWNSGVGYTSAFDVDDEGISNPPIAFTAFASFPMAGAVGNLNQMWVNSNGEIYLTDSTLGLTQPVDGASYGADSLGEMRGNIAGASARIVAFGDDLEGSTAAGAVWNISVDQTVPGQVRVTWTDMSRYVTPGDRFSFDATLYSSGAVQFSYSTTIVGDFRYAGVSIGNMVGTLASPSVDLKNGSDSGTEGLLYESFTNVSWDLTDSSILIVPNGIGGYLSTTVCGQVPAYHAAYGTGCYGSLTTDSVHEFYNLPSIASAALQGNGLLLIPTLNGYSVNWVPGGAAAFVTPTGGAVNVFATPTDDGNATITPSTPLTVPGGTTASLDVMSNGVVSMSATAAQPFGDYTPTTIDFAGSPSPAVYTWHDFNENELTGSGRIVREEVGGVLYVTWNDVESYADPDTAVNRGTVQFQFDLASGIITVCWVAISPDDSETTWLTGKPYLAGLGGPGTLASAPIVLSTGLPVTTSPNVTMVPLALSASPAPVYTPGNPAVPVTYTVNNIVDVAPPFGIGITLLIFSVAPLPGGVDMGFIGMPGCNLNIASLDVILTMPGSTAPTDSIVLTIPQPLSPGLSFYSQALSLFTPNSLPNGQNSFGGILSNGLRSFFNTL